MITATRSVTIGVSDLAEGLRLFRDIMGMQEERAWDASPSLLSAWGLPPDTACRLVELSAAGYPFGRLRLAHFEPTAGCRVRVDSGPHATDSTLDIGPKAIDFYVADPISHAFGLLKQAGYANRSVPRRHEIGHAVSEEVLFTGPDDLPILIMVGHDHRATSLRPGSPEGEFSEIATCSVIAGDLDASRRFYGETLGLVAVNDAETGEAFQDLVCDLVDAPRGTRVHFLLYAQPGEASGKILLIHFFERTGRRLTGRMRPGNLGFSLFSHETDDIDALEQALLSSGATIETRPMDVDVAGQMCRIMLAKGPNEEMFEFVQHG